MRKPSQAQLIAKAHAQGLSLSRETPRGKISVSRYDLFAGDAETIEEVSSLADAGVVVGLEEFGLFD